MKNQYSFRLTTTLLPTDTTAKTTTVINKLDSDGNKFYPTFTEETVVITNDDRTLIETTRATCNNWVLTFVKRGLSDDNTATQITNRKQTWNPGSLCFVTAGASDRIDKDDDIVWSGDQTYAGDMESRGKATYKGRLITEKWVEYPHFDSLEDLQAYESPFGWMFAVVDSDWELYRYNAVDEEWSVVTTSTPAQPAQASDVAIGTVRVATDAEFSAGTDQWSNDEYLMATVSQIKANTPSMDLNITHIWQYSQAIHVWETKSLTFNVTKPWFILVGFTHLYKSSATPKRINVVSWSSTWWSVIEMSRATLYNDNYTWWVDIYTTYAVPAWTFTLTWSFREEYTSWNETFNIWIDDYFYFW